jgi:HK97 family phage portal protein
VADSSGSVELVRVVDRRHTAEHERAFPRNPAAPPNDQGPYGAVAPQAVDGEVMGVEHAPADVPPGVAEPPRAMAWSGWPSDWVPPWDHQAARTSRVTTVWSCVRLNSSALSTMTPAIHRGRQPLPRGAEGWRSWLINPQPELYSGWDEFAQQVDVSLELRGNCYVVPTSWYADGFPRTFFVRDPDTITPRLEDGVRRLYDSHGADVTDDGILHLRYLTIPGQAAGLSPLEGAATNLRGAAALEQYGANLAVRGGIPWGTIESDQRLTPRQAGLAKAEYLASRGTLDGAPAFLPYGMKMNTLTLSPKDMALLDLRVFDEQRIAGAFGVPPSMVNLPAPEGLTYANIVDRRTEHYVQTLRPIASKVAAALSIWALPGLVALKLNASEYLAGTTQQRVESWLPALAAGAITVDEYRELVGLPPQQAGADVLAEQTSGTQ